jgi:hypothetical protein
MAGYLKNSLSPSAAEKVIEQFDPTGSVTSPFLESFNSKFPTVDKRVQEVYENGLQGSDTVDGYFNPEPTPATPPAAGGTPAWTFICAPEDISWDTSNAVQRIGIFGTNNPPVVSGSRGMRDLTLGNALVEGFIRNVTVEKKIIALEKLLNYRSNISDGFVSVPVYRVKANDKSYGNSGLFVIKEVRVKESMRDLKGDATRATVDVSFMEVPEYQVNSGRDLASKPAAAVKARALPDAKETRNAQQAAVKAAATAKANQGVGTAGKPVAGAGSAKPDTNKPKAKFNTGTRISGVSVAPKEPGQ